jgi:putative transposase
VVDRATEVALFRYSLIREAADEALKPAERGRLVRALAEVTHEGPLGRVRVSRETLDRWIRAWRTGGFEALKPAPRHVNPQTPAEVLELAERLRRENPERTGAHICEILRTVNGWSPDQRTIQRHLARRGLNRKELSATAVAFGRFEALSMASCFCPVADSGSARWWPAELPSGGRVFCPERASWPVVSPPCRRWLG